MNKLSMLSLVICILGCSTITRDANPLPDAPELTRNLSLPYQSEDSYHRALDHWKTAEDISKWVAHSFIYDEARAVQLSTNQSTRKKSVSVYDPAEFFLKKAAVCVDLARFGCETLRRIDPTSDPKYLMIEFDPIQINGTTFRLHWLVSFKRDGMRYFFCDSKRPGYIAGPYESTQGFISEYEEYRGRQIIAHRELESYKKRRKLKSLKGRVTTIPHKENAPDG
jgi:hypothetical protein